NGRVNPTKILVEKFKGSTTPSATRPPLLKKEGSLLSFPIRCRGFIIHGELPLIIKIKLFTIHYSLFPKPRWRRFTIRDESTSKRNYSPFTFHYFLICDPMARICNP